jgi:hypothetical protein
MPLLTRWFLKSALAYLVALLLTRGPATTSTG